VLFHDPDADLQLCMDLRSTDYHGPDTAGMEKSQALYTMEQKAEQRRLLYVAMTRASAMCRIFWCGISGIADSALGSMVHPKGGADDADMAADLQALANDQKKICVQFLAPSRLDTPLSDEKKQVPELQARNLTRQIRPWYGITSFSALARGTTAQPGGTAAIDPDPRASPGPASLNPDPGTAP
jgi:exodeoxyribonuclease V beta subunit